jgi:hypothetical protein
MKKLVMGDGGATKEIPGDKGSPSKTPHADPKSLLETWFSLK